MTTRHEADSPLPLIVDIDGALARTDPGLELIWQAMGADLGASLRAARGGLEALNRISPLNPDLLPLRHAVIELITQARTAGRPVILVTRLPQSLADGLAKRLALPGQHYGAGTGDTLAAMLGPAGYDYAGRRNRDTVLAQNARQVIAVAPRRLWPGPPVDHTPELGHRWQLSSLWRELRPHQWVKNLLLLLPLLAAHDFSAAALIPALIALLAFCAGASSIYIVNDLLDLEADRQHPEKRNRPIASGDLPIDVGLAASVALALLALGIGGLVSTTVAALIAIYMALSLAYSLHLKALRWLDLGVLVTLYMLRIMTGAAASGIAISAWLAVFVAAVFLTLAAVKRLTGLARSKVKGHLPGRGYGLEHMTALHRVGLAGLLAAYGSLVVYALSPHALEEYARPWMLHIVAIPVAVWLWRMIRLSMQGKEDYDPILFVAHDRTGQMIALFGVALYLLAL